MRTTADPPRRALLVDALGTLIELQPPAPALRHELSARRRIEIDLDQADRALRAEIAYYRSHLQEARDPDSLADLRRRCAEVLRGALPASEALGAVGTEELTEALLAALRFRAFADARPALIAARRRGQRVVVISNWDVSLNEVLDRIGLAALVDGVVMSAVIGVRKPSPGIFEAALSLAGAAPGEAVHVGDSVEEDVDGARAAGIEAVLLRRDGSPGPDGVRTIRSLTELESGA
jgi:putative hydrolase of the HAD superfamily